MWYLPFTSLSFQTFNHICRKITDALFFEFPYSKSTRKFSLADLLNNLVPRALVYLKELWGIECNLIFGPWKKIIAMVWFYWASLVHAQCIWNTAVHKRMPTAEREGKSVLFSHLIKIQHSVKVTWVLENQPGPIENNIPRA